MEFISSKAVCDGAGWVPCRSRRPLRLITFLAPNLFWFYRFVGRHLARKLRYPMQLAVGRDYAELSGRADLAFVCGLPYVEHTRQPVPQVEPLAAPVLIGQRYLGRPIYFSDIIVHRDSLFRSLADLRGHSWAYNEPHSQSGYGITRYHLASRGETNGYFGRVIEAGWHERAIDMVAAGAVDGSAVDSHVLAIAFRRDLSLADRLRVVETLGPSSIQPIVAARRLSDCAKSEIRQVLLGMANDAAAKPMLQRALVERFEHVTDSTYDDIRRMLAVTEAANYCTWPMQ